MSSINDALRRVERNQARPLHFTHGVPVREIKIKRSRIGLGISLILTVGILSMVALLFWPSSPDGLTTNTRTIATSGPPSNQPVRQKAEAVKPSVETRSPLDQQQTELAPSTESAPWDLVGIAAASEVLGMDEKAIIHYQKALQMNPRHFQAYLGLGNLYFRNRNYKDALRMYDQALDIDPGSKTALNNKGVIHLRNGEMEKAEAAFSDAIEKDKQYVDALYNMACLAARRGRDTLALSYLFKAARIKPEAVNWAKGDSDLSSLHQKKDFVDLLNAFEETIEAQ